MLPEKKLRLLKVIPPIKPWIVKHAKEDRGKEIPSFTRGAWTVVLLLGILALNWLLGCLESPSDFTQPFPRSSQAFCVLFVAAVHCLSSENQGGNSRGKKCLLYRLPSPRVQVCFNRPFIYFLFKEWLFTKVEWKMWGEDLDFRSADISIPFPPRVFGLLCYVRLPPGTLCRLIITLRLTLKVVDSLLEQLIHLSFLFDVCGSSMINHWLKTSVSSHSLVASMLTCDMLPYSSAYMLPSLWRKLKTPF